MKYITYRVLLLSFVLFSFALPARADWREASSDHFLIYAEDSESDLRRFATKLERFHAAMDFLLAGERQKPSPSNRVTIYVVSSQRDVRELYDSKSRRIGGFYSPRASGSIAVVPQIERGGKSDNAMLALYHEYAHHFLWSSFNYAIPAWLSEGSAEFFASVAFNSDGTLKIGQPAVHRSYEIFKYHGLHVEHLLDPDAHGTTPLETNGFYGKSWLLYHYLTFSADRRGQLEDYQRKLQSGMTMANAAMAAFGDLDELDKDLDRYARQSRMSAFTLSPETTPSGPINIRVLNEGEAAIMPTLIRSKAGVNEETAIEVLAATRDVALRYPDAPFVLSQLAEAEYDAGNDREAIAAADRAIAGDPNQLNAYVQKGYALFRLASQADDMEAAYAVAREPFLALNKIEHEHAIPLVYFYRSYRMAGLQPPEIALAGLEKAVELAPFDQGLRLEYAAELLLEGKTDHARRMLRPVAYDPHRGPLADIASNWLAELDAGTAPALVVEAAARRGVGEAESASSASP